MKDSRDNVDPPLSGMSLCEGSVTFEVEGEQLVFYAELQGFFRKKFATVDAEFFGPAEDVKKNLRTLTDAMYQIFLEKMKAQGHTVLSERRKGSGKGDGK